VHCAALSPTLLESELFGHEKGAFTGAHEKRIGRFEQAQGGTLFLDEIGEIDATLQVKLLRFLGERTFERVGSNKTLTADVRLIAATNKNLQEEVKAGKFRDDLYFRLRVVEITLPPLRQRPEDIPLLAQAFLREFVRRTTKSERFHPRRSRSTDELRLARQRARTAHRHRTRGGLSRGDRIGVRDLPAALRAGSPAADQGRWLAQPDLTVAEAEKQLIVRALKEGAGNRTLAAQKLGMSRRTLHRKLHSYHLEEF
jgi:two-component system response regulator AtoC